MDFKEHITTAQFIEILQIEVDYDNTPYSFYEGGRDSIIMVETFDKPNYVYLQNLLDVKQRLHVDRFGELHHYILKETIELRVLDC